MSPVTIWDKLVFAPLSWFTADLEKEPTKTMEKSNHTHDWLNKEISNRFLASYESMISNRIR